MPEKTAYNFYLLTNCVSLHIIACPYSERSRKPVLCGFRPRYSISSLIADEVNWEQYHFTLPHKRYTVQIMTQKNSKPTVTSLLLNLESVSSAVAGAVLLGNRMGGLEYFGCMLMLAVVIFAQLARELNISDLRKCVAGFQVHPVPEGVKLKKAHSTLR